MNGDYRPMDVVLDGWRLEKQIGAGSFGKVFSAVYEDSTFGKTYRAAVKIITVSPDAGGLDDMDGSQLPTSYTRSVVDQMLYEIDLMYRLKGHSNIVSYEGHAVVPHDDGVGWDIIIRMELLTPLRRYMQEHPMTQRDVICLGMDMCKALELCQKYNIIHRDIKPENIFVSQQGDFKLGDFGIARTMERTYANMSKKGTYNYMAPEVYLGRPYGPAADIYSLGMVLYRLLNHNRIPFLPPAPHPITVADQEQALMRRINGEPLPAPVNARGRMAEIVCKACAWDPAARYTAPWLLRADLYKILYPQQDAGFIYPEGDGLGDMTEVSGEVDVGQTRKKGGRKTALWLIPVVVLLLGTLAAGGFLLLKVGAQRQMAQRYERYLEDASDCQDDPEEALELLEDAMALRPEDPRAYEQYAYILYQDGQYEACLEFAEDGPESRQLGLIAASAAFELGDFRQAASYYYDAAKDAEEELSVENLRDYAVCLGRVGRLEEAATVFVMLTDRGPSADVTDYVLAETYYAKGQFDLAAEGFRQVLDTTRDKTLQRRCCVSLAEACREQEDYEGLVEACREGLKILPGNTVLLEMQGSGYYQLAIAQKDPQLYLQAAECFREVIAGGIVKDYLYINVITACNAAGDLEGAYDAAVEMTEMFPKNYTPYAMLATVRILQENQKDADTRDYTAAYEAYEQALMRVKNQDDMTYMDQLEGLVAQLRAGGWLS